MPEVLPEFGLLALAFFALALAFVARALTKALFGGLISLAQGIPVIGHKLDSLLHSVENAIVGACGAIYNGSDRLIGWSWHQIAVQANWLWREIKAGALFDVQLAKHVASLIYAHAGLRTIVHDLTRGAHSVGGRIKTLEREYHGLEHGVRDLSRYVHRVIGRDVLPEIRSLDRELTNIESKVIPDIRSIANTAENDVTALRKWITDHIPLVGTTAFAGAVAWALGRLGLGGLRCSTLGNMLNRRGCGLWSDLEGILGLLADTLLLTNVCTLLPLLETAVSDVADPLVIALTDVGAGLCSGGIGPPGALPVPALSLPAAPGISLSLP